MRVLIFGVSSRGEAIFSTPLVRALKTLPAVPVVCYAMPKSWWPGFEENPYIDQLLEPGEVNFSHLRRAGYDYIVVLGERRLVRLRFAALLTGVSWIRVPPHRWAQWLLVRLGINKLNPLHRADRMVKAVASLGAKQDELGLDYFIPEKDNVPATWLPPGFTREFVLLAMDAPYATRRLPVNRIIELCDKINKPVILTGTRENDSDAQVVENFFQRHAASDSFEEGLEALNKKTVVYNGCGKFNDNQLASLAQQALCVFTFDSEMVPVASAFRKQIFLILGNTVPLFGDYPYQTRFVILQNNKLTCRPCSSRGYSKCPKGHFKCMEDVVFDFYIS